jgi:hypothetical protein
MATDRVRLTVYLPGELVEAYKLAGVRKHMSVSQLVEQAMVIAAGGEIMVKERHSGE